jgi:hypothetical protein
VYTYCNDVLIAGQSAAPISPMSAIAQIDPNPTMLQAYERWGVKRRALLGKGKQERTSSTLLAIDKREREALPPNCMKNLASFSRLPLHFRLRKAMQMALKDDGRHTGTARKNNREKVVEKAEVECLLENILTSPLFARAQAATERFVGLPFTLYRENCFFEGRIDLAFIENGDWVIGALLTDEKPEAKEEEGGRTDHAHLFIQALALEELTKRRVREFIVVFVCSQKEQCITLSDEYRASAQATLRILPHAVGTTQ